MKLNKIVFVVLLLIIILFSSIIVGCGYQEYQITAHGETGPGIRSVGGLHDSTYYATKIISFDKTSVRFIEKSTGQEKFITAEEIYITRIK